MIALYKKEKWTNRLVIVAQDRMTSLRISLPLVFKVVPVEVVRADCRDDTAAVRALQNRAHACMLLERSGGQSQRGCSVCSKS
jgi:hypothetical protein